MSDVIMVSARNYVNLLAVQPETYPAMSTCADADIR